MMRFRAAAWSLGISAAATGLYLVSLQVAAERGALEATELNIALVQADMRRLRTELGTRASQRQLEQWNGEVLALSTPEARQFVANNVRLASLNADMLDRAPGAPTLVAVNATMVKPAPRAVPPLVMAAEPARPAPAIAANLRYLTYTADTAPAGRAPVTAPAVRKVAFTTDAPAVEPAKPLAKPRPKDGAKPTMLQSGTLASLAKAARAEGGR